MTFGVLPNSPPHHTIVFSNSPRSARSCRRVAIPLSISGNSSPHGLEIIFVRVPAALVVNGDIRDAAFDQPPRHQARLPKRVLAITLSQVALFLRQIEHLARVAQDQVISLFSACAEAASSRIARHGMGQRVQLVQQLAPLALAEFGNFLADHAFHRERCFRWIAPGGKRLEARPQKPRLGKTPLWFGQHNVRRNQPAIIRVVALEK